MIKDKGYSKDDIKIVLEEIFWYTEEEARAVLKQDEAPIIAKITANAMLKAMKSGNMDRITKAFEYVLGEPDAKISIRADQEKRLADFMMEAQDIDFEEVYDKIGPPITSEDKYQSMILDFKKKMESDK